MVGHLEEWENFLELTPSSLVSLTVQHPRQEMQSQQRPLVTPCLGAYAHLLLAAALLSAAAPILVAGCSFVLDFG